MAEQVRMMGCVTSVILSVILTFVLIVLLRTWATPTW
jgi:hypothetical protein